MLCSSALSLRRVPSVLVGEIATGTVAVHSTSRNRWRRRYTRWGPAFLAESQRLKLNGVASAPGGPNSVLPSYGGVAS